MTVTKKKRNYIPRPAGPSQAQVQAVGEALYMMKGTSSASVEASIRHYPAIVGMADVVDAKSVLGVARVLNSMGKRRPRQS